MATQKSTQAAPNEAVENLLGQIASTAYVTEERLRNTPGDMPELYESEIEMLRGAIARIGWMADIALQRLGSCNTMRDGNAEQWLLTPRTVEILRKGDQS